MTLLSMERKESEVAQLCPTLWPHGLLPTRLLHPQNFPGKSTGVGCRFLLQEIFPTQGLNPGLLLCGQMLYCLSHQGSLKYWRWSEGKKWIGKYIETGKSYWEKLSYNGGNTKFGQGYRVLLWILNHTDLTFIILVVDTILTVIIMESSWNFSVPKLYSLYHLVFFLLFDTILVS